MDHRIERSSGVLHEYILDVVLENTGSKQIDDWHVDIQVPTPLLRKFGVVWPPARAVRAADDSESVSERPTRRGDSKISPRHPTVLARPEHCTV